MKLPYNAAHALDQSTILEIIDKNHGDLKVLFLGIDIVTYAGDTGTRAYPLPEHLYDENIWNDTQYWWNKDVLVNYILVPLLTKEEADDIHIVYNKYYFDGLYNEQYTLNNFQAAAKSQKGPVPKDYYLEALRESMETHIIPYIEKHPKTEITVFFPLYSILFWHGQVQENCLDARLAEYAQIVEMLSGYSNVSMFFFANNEAIICDLNNYKDYTHYSRKVAEQLTRHMSAGDMEITRENYEAEINKLKKIVEEFDFTQWEL